VPVIDGGGTVTDLFFLDAGTQNVTIDHLTFQNCVSSAIHLNGYRTSTSDGTIRGCVISNNTIQFVTGSTSGGAGGTGGIRGTFAVENNTIRNNLITDTTGPSITLVGGSAGETISGNTISFNECLRSNTSNLADTGGIYLLDRGHNASSALQNVIDNNYVEGIGTSADTRLIYLDDETSKVLISNNVLTGSASSALQLHGSDHVAVTNNIIDLTGMSYIGLYQDDASSGFINYGMAGNTFQTNIVYSGGAFASSALWAFNNGSGDAIATPATSRNLYYSTGPALPSGGTIVDSSPATENPLFTNADRRSNCPGDGRWRV